jgi:hypothetical protein
MAIEFSDAVFCFKPLTRLQGARDGSASHPQQQEQCAQYETYETEKVYGSAV